MYVSFHDQFVIWYQNSYVMYCAGFFGVWGGGGYHLVRVGFCGAVNIVRDEALQLWR